MYDVVVIGGGPGGYAGAIRTAQLGGKVALVEAAELGGTCVNKGCIPSKIWLRSARLARLFNQSDMFGIEASVKRFNLKTLVERKNGVASEIRTGMNALLANNGVDFISGRATVKSAGEVEVEGDRLSTRNIILATGSSLSDPDQIPGLKEAALTTDQIFDLESVPASVLIFGEAGSIEVEMATLLNTFGCDVYLTTNHPRILPREDGDTSQRIARALREQGIQIATRMELTEVQKIKNGFQPHFSGNDSPVQSVEKVLLSSRKSNLDGLNVEDLGIRLNEDGFVWVDANLKTSVSGIYAIGDLTGGWMVSHAASTMAVTAAENIMDQAKTYDFNLIPRGIWTSPQVGAIGLSEEEAEEKGFEVEVGNFPCSVNGLAASYGEVEGATKIVWDAETRDILGVHIVAPYATEMMGEAVMALQLECSIDEIAHSIRIHPTISETIQDAGRDSANWALYLPKS